MNVKGENICRLCLKVTRNEFLQINEVIKKMFDILLLNLNLNVTKDPVICQDCVEVAKKCLDFKLTCLDTDRTILLFSTSRGNEKHDIRVIYEERECVEKILEQDISICRFCMTRLERNNFISLDTLRNMTNISEMLPVPMPEMDFNIIEEPVICTTCQEDLKIYFKFILNSLATENKIKAYCKNAGANSRDPIKLSNVLNILFRDINIVHRPEKFAQICTIKEESNTFENTECVHPDMYSGLIKLKDVLDIKTEDNNSKKSYYKTLPDLGLDRHGDIVYLAKEHNVDSDKMYKCSSCAYETKRKSHLTRHMLVHKSISEIKMHKCPLCDYEFTQDRYLKRHLLVHKDVSEIIMYKCSLCDFETKHKGVLKRHMLQHKDVSEIKMHKCSLCDYETKQKRYLIDHFLKHKDISEIKMHKCSLCEFQTKHKGSLRRHMSVHKDVSEIIIHKCSLCDYEATQKEYLRDHLLIHKDVSEIKMHKCSLCEFQTKHKSSLRRHTSIHKDVCEVIMHKCSLCDYQAKHKEALRLHLLVHKDRSEIQKYKCASCPHETIRKNQLTKHMIVHKDASQIKMYRCSFCAFESKYKQSLKNHVSPLRCFPKTSGI